MLFGLSLLALEACKKLEETTVERVPGHALSVPVSQPPAPSASAPPPAASPPPSAPASPADRYDDNLRRAREEITGWQCSANKPVVFKPSQAALVTFRCPEGKILTSFDAVVNEGFVLVGAGPYPNRDGLLHHTAVGAQQMDLVKTAGGGLLHRTRGGKTSALVVRYTTLDLVAIPTGYRAGGLHDRTDVFELTGDEWEAARETPHEIERGFLFGKDPAPIFPYDALSLHLRVCKAADARCTEDQKQDWVPLELLETWDGARYAGDLRELAPAYRARLRAVRGFVEAQAAAAPDAGAPTVDAGTVDAGPVPSLPPADAGPVAAASASAPPRAPGAGASGPYASDDAGSCPLGLLRAVVETFAIARLLDDVPERAMASADAVMATFPEALCKRYVGGLPSWSTLHAKLVALPAQKLERTRPAP